MDSLIQLFSGYIGEILITFVGGVVYVIKHFREKKRTSVLGHKLEQVTNELMTRREALSFSKYTSEWNEFVREIDNLGNTTSMDRFLILNAWNGHLDPERVTASFQRHYHNHPTTEYVGVDVDDFYNTMLKTIERNGSARYKTQEITGDLKAYYESEGVTESIIFFIEAKLYEGGGRSVGFCSFATHEPDGFIEEDIARFRAVVGRIKMLALSFEDKHTKS